MPDDPADDWTADESAIDGGPQGDEPQAPLTDPSAQVNAPAPSSDELTRQELQGQADIDRDEYNKSLDFYDSNRPQDQQQQQQQQQLPPDFSNLNLDPNLEGLYQQNPQYAQMVHETIEYQRDLDRSGLSRSDISYFVKNAPKYREMINQSEQVNDTFNTARAYAEAGHLDKALETLQLDTAKIEDFYTGKSLARDDDNRLTPEWERQMKALEDQAQIVLERISYNRNHLLCGMISTSVI